jgi:hypothetical protein
VEENLNNFAAIGIVKNNYMSKRQLLYIPIWEKYIDRIRSACSLDMGAGFPIPSSYFKNAGNRKSYGFRIEIKNGKVVNDISGSAVARDLAFLLLENADNKKLLARKHFFIRMSDAFYLEAFPVKLYKGILAGKIN